MDLSQILNFKEIYTYFREKKKCKEKYNQNCSYKLDSQLSCLRPYFFTFHRPPNPSVETNFSISVSTSCYNSPRKLAQTVPFMGFSTKICPEPAFWVKRNSLRQLISKNPMEQDICVLVYKAVPVYSFSLDFLRFTIVRSNRILSLH